MANRDFGENQEELSWKIRVMEVWLEKAGPWVEVLLRGVAVTVEVVKGKPRLVVFEHI